jgi:TPR repeat protein
MSRSVLFDRANDEWEAGNVRKAFELFSQAATAGDPFAQTSLGYFYDEGIGVKKNAEKAIWWYRKAARKGSVAAINNLAITYRDSGNLRRARSWFKKAFSKGDGDAALELAKLSLAGRRQDAKSAKKYLEAAVGSKYILSDSLTASVVNLILPGCGLSRLQEQPLSPARDDAARRASLSAPRPSSPPRRSRRRAALRAATPAKAPAPSHA